MQSFLISAGLVAVAEIGDKTQLLSLMLAARFRKPAPIIAGILAATLANHAFAGALGAWVSGRLGATALSWTLAFSFLAMAVWMLVPDKAEGLQEGGNRLGIFGTTVLAFFLAEMGDKTQIATIALAARYQAFVPVVAGTTIGMLLANVPVVYAGDTLSKRIPLKPIRFIAAGACLILAIAAFIKAAA